MRFEKCDSCGDWTKPVESSFWDWRSVCGLWDLVFSVPRFVLIVIFWGLISGFFWSVSEYVLMQQFAEGNIVCEIKK